MSRVVEVIYGKHDKYEIYEVRGSLMGLLGSTGYMVYRNGSFFKGSYSSLSAAVEAARRAG